MDAKYQAALSAISASSVMEPWASSAGALLAGDDAPSRPPTKRARETSPIPDSPSKRPKSVEPPSNEPEEKEPAEPQPQEEEVLLVAAVPDMALDKPSDHLAAIARASAINPKTLEAELLVLEQQLGQLVIADSDVVNRSTLERILSKCLQEQQELELAQQDEMDQAIAECFRVGTAFQAVEELGARVTDVCRVNESELQKQVEELERVAMELARSTTEILSRRQEDLCDFLPELHSTLHAASSLLGEAPLAQ
jgi:hypothetical protein